MKKAKNNSLIFIGDKFKWIGLDEKKLGKNLVVAPTSRTVKHGEICEITKTKMIKGVLYVRAKNLSNNENIRLLFDGCSRPMPYCEDGNWLEFDKYFEITQSFIRNKKLKKIKFV